VIGLNAHGHRHALPLTRPEDLPALIRSLAKPGDYIVFLGAGNITQWAHALPGQLAAEALCDALAG
jgi:UDP-N-acetylmuramate--alanine ligase